MTSSPETLRIGPRWADVRLIHGPRAGLIERTCLADAAQLLARALDRSGDRPVPVVSESDVAAQGGYRDADVLVTCPPSSPDVPADRAPQSTGRGTGRGAYRVRSGAHVPGYTIVGADPEGVRNGLYHFLSEHGFGFFRDGETVPDLAGARMPTSSDDREVRPAFAQRGDMIWDFYTGPRRYCAKTWGLAEWRRALLYLARRGCNFLEYYPPLEAVMLAAFPEARELAQGLVWTAEYKHELAREVLDFGRSLGIQFMYVLTYGQFPAAVQALHDKLQWRNGFLCAHQPELAEFTRVVWGQLIRELGTDHWYAVRHRGEEGQSYSDPCRSVSKAQGMAQAFSILRALDSRARVTVWTWAEKLPDLFAELPGDIRAAHIRHGMGGVFADVAVGREQADGAPDLPPGRRWLAGHFTVFSGSEAGLRSQWSDADALARDARAAAADEQCDGLFQWPEWSNTSPWLSHAITELAWAPGEFSIERDLPAYARSRHGARAEAYLTGFRPLLAAGNARFVSTPRKRMLCPYALSMAESEVCAGVRKGLGEMVRALPSAGPDAGPEATSDAIAISLFTRDTIDLACWLGVRQVQQLEVAAYRAFVAGEGASVQRYVAAVGAVWSAVRDLLSASPDTTIADGARNMAAEGPLSADAVEHFFVHSSDFYGGYPLVLSPEAIELAFAPQSRLYGEVLLNALDKGERQPLGPAGWFWRDFPDPAWAQSVRLLPREDKAAFERDMRQRIGAALAEGARERASASDLRGRGTGPYMLPAVSLVTVRAAVAALLEAPRPDPLAAPPDW